MKTVRFNIDDAKRHRRFVHMLKEFFKEDMKQETFKIAAKECDLIEFAFKKNGFVGITGRDLRED